MPNEARIKKVFEWIDNDSDLSLVTLYFSIIDDTGHAFGPESPEMSLALSQLNEYLEIVTRALRARSLLDKVNLLIVSDHGMIQATLNTSNILIEEFIPELKTMVTWMDYNVVTTVFPLVGRKLLY